MSQNLKQLGEFGLIKGIRKAAPVSRRVIKGIGDDAAVLDTGAKEWLLVTTDMLAEGTHFTSKDRPAGIGHKALACSISDIAAMGGIPTFAVISLGAPAKTPLKTLKRIQAGMIRTANRYGVSIVGGDTIRHEKLVINVAMLGRVGKKHLITRAGARPGDGVFVTGPLGGSLKSGRHLTFCPRLAQAQFLVRRFKPSAMIDISDGLVSDLGHILDESRAGAVLHQPWIPHRKGITLKQALGDGEDFELLFTLPPDKAVRLKRMKTPPYRFYEIGRITAQCGCLFMRDDRGIRPLKRGQGFAHF